MSVGKVGLLFINTDDDTTTRRRRRSPIANVFRLGDAVFADARPKLKQKCAPLPLPHDSHHAADERCERTQTPRMHAPAASASASGTMQHTQYPCIHVQHIWFSFRNPHAGEYRVARTPIAARVRGPRESQPRKPATPTPPTTTTITQTSTTKLAAHTT